MKNNVKINIYMAWLKITFKLNLGFINRTEYVFRLKLKFKITLKVGVNIAN